MRQFPHRPDVAALDDEAEFVYSGVDEVAETVASAGPAAWPNLGVLAIDTAWEAIALAWAQERPAADVVAFLRQADSWARQALTAASGGVSLARAQSWLATFLVAGDWDAARALASRLPGLLVLDIADNAPVADVVVAVARLVDGGDPGPAVRELRQHLADPRIAPELAARLSPELQLIDGIARADQAQVQAGFTALIDWHVETFSRTASDRRSVPALVSRTGLMFAALASSRRLTIPLDNPYLPLMLFEQQD